MKSTQKKLIELMMAAKKQKILLCTFNVQCKKADNFPLALLFLRSYALKDSEIRRKARIDIAEFNNDQSDEEILKKIREFGPQLIGFSCYMWNYEKTLSVAIGVKKNYPGIKIIIGGPQVSPMAEELIRKSEFIDVVVKGEGEATFAEFIKKHIAQKDTSKIRGIVCRSKGKVVSNGNREQINDLDSIPSPYDNKLLKLKNRKVSIETQRGCIFRCGFCYYHKSYKGVRFWSLKRVKRDLKLLLSKKLTELYIMDPVFNINLGRAKEICRFLIKHNKNMIPLHTELRAELVDEELAILMNRANFKIVEIGLQSTNRSTLKNVNRKLNMKRFKQGVGYLKENMVPMDIHLIYGLPGEDKASFMRSLDDCMDFAPANLYPFRLMVIPGTEIWSNAHKYGIIYEKRPDYKILYSRTFSCKDIQEFDNMFEAIRLLSYRWLAKCMMKDFRLKFSHLVLHWVEEKKAGNLRAFPPKKNIPEFIGLLSKKLDKQINGNFYWNILKKEFMESELSSTDDLL